MTQKAKAIDPSEFGKHHQKQHLETIIMDCKPCGKQTVHIYAGSDGVPWKQNHYYKCLACDNIYESFKKLR